MRRRIVLAAIWISAVAAVTGCSSAHKEIPIPEKSMLDVYEEQMTTSGHESSDRDRTVTLRPATPYRDADLHAYTRSAQNELQQLFPRLPNPMLIMYVAPHQVGGVPVPGYTTAFPMYEVDHLAQPGEVIQ